MQGPCAWRGGASFGRGVGTVNNQSENASAILSSFWDPCSLGLWTCCSFLFTEPEDSEGKRDLSVEKTLEPTIHWCVVPIDLQCFHQEPIK